MPNPRQGSVEKLNRVPLPSNSLPNQDQITKVSAKPKLVVTTELWEEAKIEIARLKHQLSEKDDVIAKYKKEVKQILRQI